MLFRSLRAEGGREHRRRRNVVILAPALPAERLAANDEVAPTLGRTQRARQAIVEQISVRAPLGGDDETVELAGRRAAEMAPTPAWRGRDRPALLSNWTSRVYLPELAPDRPREI
jgi:hypothetical protein